MNVDVAVDVGLVSRTKLYAQCSHKTMISNYQLLECEVMEKSFYTREIHLRSKLGFFVFFISQTSVGSLLALRNDPNLAVLVLYATVWT